MLIHIFGDPLFGFHPVCADHFDRPLALGFHTHTTLAGEPEIIQRLAVLPISSHQSLISHDRSREVQEHLRIGGEILRINIKRFHDFYTDFTDAGPAHADQEFIRIDLLSDIQYHNTNDFFTGINQTVSEAIFSQGAKFFTISFCKNFIYCLWKKVFRKNLSISQKRLTVSFRILFDNIDTFFFITLEHVDKKINKHTHIDIGKRIIFFDFAPGACVCLFEIRINIRHYTNLYSFRESHCSNNHYSITLSIIV